MIVILSTSLCDLISIVRACNGINDCAIDLVRGFSSWIFRNVYCLNELYITASTLLFISLGLKVDWKFFGILNQFRPRQKSSEQTEAESQQLQDEQSQLVQIESDRLEHRSYLQHEAQPEAQQIRYKTFVQPIDVQSPDPNQIQYGRYSDPHAKQVIVEDFKHPDPSSSVYAYSQQSGQHDQQSAQYETSENYGEEPRKTRREYANRGRIVYKGSYEQQQQEEPRVEQIAVPVERLPSPIPQKLVIDKNMPIQIQQLLQYQARLPYEVIANSITYKPKSLFVPKPIPVDGKGPYQYRSKVYYVNNEQYDDEFHSTKPVQENQRHWWNLEFEISSELEFFFIFVWFGILIGSIKDEVWLEMEGNERIHRFISFLYQY